MKSWLRGAFAVVLIPALTVWISGCGDDDDDDNGGNNNTTRATVLLQNTDVSSPTVGRVPVDESEIVSMLVTITQIYLVYCGPGDDPDDDIPEVVLVQADEFDPSSVTVRSGDTVRWEWATAGQHTITSGTQGDADAGSLFDESSSGLGSTVELTFVDPGVYPYFSNFDNDVAQGMTGVVRVKPDNNGQNTRAAGRAINNDVPIFNGSVDVDLVDLAQLSEVLTEANIPPGDYCGLRMDIENPRLVLANDPTTVITNVRLTANGRLFAKEHFTVPDVDNVLITVNFGGTHLVEAGNSGQFVLTPRLRVSINAEDAATTVEGEIIGVDTENQVIQVETQTDVIDVAVDPNTVITSDDDLDDVNDQGTDATLTFASLAVGQTVSVEGFNTLDGPVNADFIEIADESIATNAITVTGPITGIDAVNNAIQVQTGTGTLEFVAGANTAISSDDDSDDATTDTGATIPLVFGNLAVAQVVTVQALQFTGNPTLASTILIADESIIATP